MVGRTIKGAPPIGAGLIAILYMSLLTISLVGVSKSNADLKSFSVFRFPK